eukprot:TRINITY_DN1616_c0_g2_i1.p1 TRINITY_DN1616_c0_g2~~TRINITY_DN1616_c0_g2_i1.p1  ORF type:complete len:571 (+),score=204.43 TRINITY_DN1616_c0_g2_i1:63-1775(+)
MSEIKESKQDPLEWAKQKENDILYLGLAFVPTLFVFSTVIFFFWWLILLFWLLGGAALYLWLAQFVERATAAAPLPKSKPLVRHLSVWEKVKPTEINPFVNPKWKITEAERLRLTLMGITLAPLRLIFIVVVLSIISFVLSITALKGLNKEKLSQPFEASRRATVELVCRLGSRLVMLGLGFWYIPTKGKPAKRDQAPVVIANHITFIEPIFLLSQFVPSPVGAAEHLKAPLIGKILQAIQAIPVDRRSKTSKQDVKAAIHRRATEPGWPQVLIFPEGTCTSGDAMVCFKYGAFGPGAAVQPCLVRYHNQRHNPCWVSAGPPAPCMLFRVLCEPANFMSVEFMEPYKPSEEEKQDSGLYARNVRLAMCAQMGIPATEHSFEDVLLQNEAMANNLPAEAGVVEFEKVRASFRDVTLDQIKEKMQQFRKMDKSGDGKLSLEEFLSAYEFKDRAIGAHLFQLLDVDDTGEIDFREYLIGLGLLNSDTDPDAMIRLAFRMFDLDNDEKIQINDLRSVFRNALPDLPEAEVTRIFAQIDVNEEGKIHYEAFKKFALQDPRYVQLFREKLHLQPKP